MTITVGLTHITHYKYDRPVSLSPQTVRLRPSPHNKVPITAYSFKVKPDGHFLNWYQDIFGNYVANIVFNERVTEFKIEVDLKAEIRTTNPFDFFITGRHEEWPFTYDDLTAKELGNYLEISESGPLLLKWIEQNIDRSKKHKTIDLMVDVNRRMNESLGYIIRMDAGVYSPEELFTEGKGSCRDFAWTMCQIFRHLGFASRFVSGYSIQLKTDIKPLTGPAGVEEDVVDLHAWCEVYVPGAGWVGMDATSGLLCGEGHIPLSASPLPFQSAPVEGAVDQCNVTMKHKMKLLRVHEQVRVTKPFSESQWHDIEKLARKVDKQLEAGDIRLTIGGEPTFVSTENRDAPEWNTKALGKEKREKAVELLFRLKERFAPEGSIHFGQGKWYGGEVLPRWALGCFSRRDGEPVWKDAGLIAGEDRKHKTKAGKDKELLIALAANLSVQAEIQPAKDGTKVKGYALPLIYSITRKKWITNSWKFDGGMKLVPGDSPLGYRLPLGAVPQVKAGGDEVPPQRSNFDKLPALPAYGKLAEDLKKRAKKAASKDKEKFGYVRTAICTEIRDGRLFVFMPPTYYAEHYLELVAAVELAAANIGVAVALEGYEPPHDLRMMDFRVTPDPGVIEVNVQPAKNWKELKEINEAVYEETFKTSLTAEKFMVDGRRTGTGGGNHIIAGGATPADSPFLRRPDLLKSAISYWQNHPGLSYLFSTVFIGPTSQAPRVDEARNDSLYELEIALAQIEDKKKMPLWLVDRLLRNILVDITGNTHRSEICIDKLYAPEGERGRLGLVEFRGFEMTPHARMNLLQILLLRALIAMFWDKPYKGRLKRWGTSLHDKFMLPEYVWQDFKEVLADLSEHGFDFKEEWFLPQLNFRFPVYGVQKLGNVELELRMALEPWPVLGEEVSAIGTSRGVDTALERLQVKVKGLDTERYRLACNKYEVELHKGTEKDSLVAGIKFKAWDPPFTLHPNLKIDSPLVFDVYDMENRTSIGGCKYHVFHPGGRNYDTSPVNVNEAEGRIINRFEHIGHSKGKFDLKTIDYNSDFPYTTDLRRK